MRSVLKFIALTYLASWLLWIAAAGIMGWDVSQRSWVVAVSGPLYLLGVFVPGLVAVALTERADGRTATLALLRRTVQLSGEARWYVFAAGYFVAIELAVALAHRIATGTWPAFNQTPWFVMLVAIVFSTPVQAGEEIGWRGYLLPRLSKRVGLPLASIIIGIIWACWHLPFFFVTGPDKPGQSFPWYVLGVTAVSIPMAWLYWRTNGSLLLTMLMHAAVNNTNIVPAPVSATASPFALTAPPVVWMNAALLWLGAVYFLFQMRRATLWGKAEA
jgi:membrane protease YdiL (CAAX protease family)